MVVMMTTEIGYRGITTIVNPGVIIVPTDQTRHHVPFVAIRVKVYSAVLPLPERVPNAGHVSSMR
jgi:hypothetical protein